MAGLDVNRESELASNTQSSLVSYCVSSQHSAKGFLFLKEATDAAHTPAFPTLCRPSAEKVTVGSYIGT